MIRIASERIGRRPQIGLADLIRAADVLGANEQERLEIQALLGLLEAAPPAAPVSLRKLSTTPERSDGNQIEHKPKHDQQKPLEKHVEKGPDPENVEGPFELVSTGRHEPLRVQLNAAEALPAPDPGQAGPLRSLPPLFPTNSARNLFSALVATAAQDGPIDEGRLVELSAKCRPAARLPRRTAWTLRRGAQVLVDRSEAMVPFRNDIEDALSALGLLLGDSVSVLRFEETPLRVFRYARNQARDYRPPPAGTPVLAITDLGLRRPRDAWAWIDFAARVRRAGCPLAALVPYPPSRFPLPLASRMVAVSWDPSMTAGAVRRAARRAWRPV